MTQENTIKRLMEISKAIESDALEPDKMICYAGMIRKELMTLHQEKEVSVEELAVMTMKKTKIPKQRSIGWNSCHSAFTPIVAKLKMENESERLGYESLVEHHEAQTRDFENTIKELKSQLQAKDAGLTKRLEGVEEAVKEALAKLAKETAEKQKEEINRKGLWEAECISNSFEEIAEVLAAAIRKLVEGK